VEEDTCMSYEEEDKYSSSASSCAVLI
jgi:hypothetical protein